jgi:hypothetical protein
VLRHVLLSASFSVSLFVFAHIRRDSLDITPAEKVSADRKGAARGRIGRDAITQSSSAQLN